MSEAIAEQARPSWHVPIAGEDEIVRKNIGLVHHVLHRMGNLQLDYEDAYSVGLRALLEAVRTFDPARGCVLSTYAVIVIRGRVLRETRAAKAIKRTATGALIPLDACVPNNEGSEGTAICEVIPDKSQDTERDVESHLLVNRLLELLDPRDRIIANMAMDGYKQSEIGKQVGISQVQVSRRMSQWKALFERGEELKTIDNRAEVEALLREGKSLKEVQEATGRSQPTICKIKREIGLTRDQQKQQPEQVGVAEKVAPPAAEVKPVQPKPMTAGIWNAHKCASMPDMASIIMDAGMPKIVIKAVKVCQVELCPWCGAGLRT